MDRPDLDFWGWPNTPGFAETPCMIGLSYLSQVKITQTIIVYCCLFYNICVLLLQLTPLQTVISNAADKRIMVLDDFATSEDAALNDSHRHKKK